MVTASTSWPVTSPTATSRLSKRVKPNLRCATCVVSCARTPAGRGAGGAASARCCHTRYWVPTLSFTTPRKSRFLCRRASPAGRREMAVAGSSMRARQENDGWLTRSATSSICRRATPSPTTHRGAVAMAVRPTAIRNSCRRTSKQGWFRLPRRSRSMACSLSQALLGQSNNHKRKREEDMLKIFHRMLELAACSLVALAIGDFEHLQEVDTVTHYTPGGGGYGSPADRDPELVQADVEAGLVSLAAAVEIYGVQLEPGSFRSIEQPQKKEGG